MFYRLSLVFLFFSLSLCALQAQEATVGFWNVENLYDTIPSLFHDDADYTPGGRLRWDTGRYTAKLENLSRVLDEMSLDICGLAEVESEEAVRDLVKTLKTDYNYIHRTTGDGRGMDMVLLFKGDKFVPEQVRLVRSGSPREFLYVRGELLGQRVDMVVVHLPSKFNSRNYRERVLQSLYSFADSLHRVDAAARLVIVGDFNGAPSDRILRRSFHTGRQLPDASRPLFSPFETLAAGGIGTYARNNRWELVDNIFLSSRFLGDPPRYLRSEVFVRPYMLTGGDGSRVGYPLRTFSGRNYLGGYSDHLPLYVVLQME